ncbi:MAG TPA: hypothetical protein DCZ95_18150 [Verrucomicrobia bacterium]|nr:hypothetical protein [Verrucomicrobiota bacterium]
MPKFSAVELSKIEDRKGMAFQCPGCGCAHFVQINPKFSPCWQFNGDVERPTVSPSILVKTRWADEHKVCHSFVKDGQIQFLGDCTHALAGKTVEIPDWED